MLVADLAARLDEAIEVQEALLAKLQAQRLAIVAADHEAIGMIAAQMETDVLRLGAIESARTRITVELADALGIVSTRWAAVREGLADDERESLGARVARVESLIREIELHNTINGQLIANELTLVDFNIRNLASGESDPVTRAYTNEGGSPRPARSRSVLLNLAA